MSPLASVAPAVLLYGIASAPVPSPGCVICATGGL